MGVKAAPVKSKRISNFFVPLLLAVVSTIMILSTILYVQFSDILRRKIDQGHIDNLQRTQLTMTHLQTTARALAMQVYYDMYISKLFLYNEIETSDLYTAISQIENYRTTIPYVESIYVFNSKTDTFYTSSYRIYNTVVPKNDFFDKAAVEMVNRIDEFRTLTPLPRLLLPETLGTSGEINPNAHEGMVYSFLFYDDVTGKKESDAVIVNISDDWLRYAVPRYVDEGATATVIVDTDGHTVFDSRFEKPGPLADEDFIRRAFSLGAESGSFKSRINGTEQFVVFDKPESSEWTFITFSPYGDVMKEVNRLQQKVSVLAGVLLLVGLLVVYPLSRYLQRPVQRMMTKMVRLESEKRHHLYDSKLDFLRMWITEPKKWDRQQLAVKIDQFRIPIDPLEPTRLLLLRISDYKAFEQAYSHDERGLLKFAIANVAEEVCGPCAVAVDIGGDGVGVIAQGLSCADSTEAQEEMVLLAKKVQEAVELHLKRVVTVTASSCGYVEDAYSQYQQTAEASFHRFFMGPLAIIAAEKIMGLKQNRYEYPIDMERALNEALAAGNMEAAKQLFGAMIEGMEAHSRAAVQVAVARLLLNLNTTMDMMLRNNFSTNPFGFDAFGIILEEAETTEQIQAKVFEAFERLHETLAEKKHSKHEELVQSIISLVQERYADPSLSSETVADEVGLTSAYVGKLFKKATSLTLTDYIIDTRMEKAKHLLLSTDIVIEDVANQTGFLNVSYFYRTFKKFNGVTPAEYRRKHS